MSRKWLLCLLAIMLSGCGFEPLYVKRDTTSSWYFGGKTDTSITTEMAKVKVERIADRFGQQLRNNLLDLITPAGIPKNPQYRLKVKLISKDVVQQAMRRDITATSERVTYRVEYELLEESRTLVKGDSVAYVSYDSMANPYSTTMAQKKTETDAAKIIANDIALRLGAYFHAQQGKEGYSFDL